jgi:4-amino-4-deoxy-L-arabinose transferase-like glycosyltransferase
MGAPTRSDDDAQADDELVVGRGDAPPGEGGDAPLVPAGPPFAWRRGGAIALVGLAIALAASVAPTGPRLGVGLVGLGVVVATLGLLDLVGGSSRHDEDEVRELAPRVLTGPLGLVALGYGGFFVALRAAVAGSFGADATVARWVMGVVFTATFLAGSAGVAWSLERAGVLGRDRPWWRHEGSWLVGIVALVSLPTLGSHSLIDPWETHYGEVAREILAREDWISLWWAHEDWFWSKPILIFWLQALAMAVTGVRHEPGRMLSAYAESGGLPWPEWAVRTPIFLCSLVAVLLLSKAVARGFSRRAGFVAGLALATMPQWSFLTHQTMTDMPFVAAMTAGIALAMLGLEADPEARIVRYELVLGSRRLGFSAWHVVVGLVTVLALAQSVHLVSKNLALGIDPKYGLMWPPLQVVSDSFVAGSPGACGTAGNSPCAEVLPSLPRLQPALQALLWLQALGLFLWLVAGERRVRRLCFVGAYAAIALAVMAKGPAGLGLPVVAVIAWVIASRRPKALLDAAPMAGIAILACVALPWFVAAYARHGAPFTERLLFHDMVKRAFDHVHDTNQGEDTSVRYYLWQLGYACFPWVGLAPAGFASLASTARATSAAGRSGALLLGWMLVGFALFSAMGTKFHHYVFPIVPALAALVGVGADRALSAVERPTPAHQRSAWALALGLGAPLVWLVGRDLYALRDEGPRFDRLLHLFTYNYERPWPERLDYGWPLVGFTAVAALALGTGAIATLRAHAARVFAVVAIAFAAWCLDVYLVDTAPHWGQRELALRHVEASRAQPGPLVAYQMNWKGENFYTGNGALGFVSTGKALRDHLAAERRRGQKVFYFVLMHGRVGALKTELGKTSSFEALSTREQNNKFTLVRASY